ncbi:aldose 1-epimerase [Vibrio sp. 10N.222.51.C8]|uniref:aldose 1-epimerase n=1 Tax=unclassified Vibrio TaxID=2614977 RepID=UPI000C82D6E0|nr:MULTISPECIES: aldose 1-epimerase [unclassified Vibrio]PMN99563.1 galactose mutarotase [Vibrio sp. 10N.222.55.C12]PMO09388.1 galactose mutarotase [Vibrio sp. 10N.222.54.F10]PMO26737.1 galactose mutarotase [Vibrio sp. 10N.222.54.B6]TKF39324.1 aldose 1-epimerase [Vibrio sp. F13]TKF52482.1 aldose 1-epimerase [Vibrio sp. F13]
MFKIINEKFGNIDSVTLINYQHGIELQIINEFGAIINKYIVNNSPFSFICGYQNYDELINQHPFFSRSAKLFPFPNRLNLGRYSFDNQNHQLPANFPWSDHAVHGLLYNQPFSITNSVANEELASVTMQYQTSSLHPAFPFAFNLEVTFTIDITGKLTSSTTVSNLGDSAFPFGDAWHPYFSLGTELAQCGLAMSPCSEVIHENDLPNGEKHAFDRLSLDDSLTNQSLNHCFEFDSKTTNQLAFTRSDSSAAIRYQQDESYPFVQLYTPTSEQSIAIEPMTCPADAFNNQIGLLTLSPNQSQTFTWQCQATYQPT